MDKKTLLGLMTGVSALLCTEAAQAQDFVMGQTIIVGFNFCPRGTISAEGQILPISQNAALFSLMGTIWGGDGRTTFGLPDLRGRMPIGWGQGPGLPNYPIGAKAGAETTTLTISTMPAHTHTANAVGTATAGSVDNPANAVSGQLPLQGYTSVAPDVSMKDGTAVANNSGGGQPFSNINPYTALRFCVVSQGIFPPRN